MVQTKNKAYQVVSPFYIITQNLTGLPFRARMMVMDLCSLFHCVAKITASIKNQK